MTKTIIPVGFEPQLKTIPRCSAPS